MKKLFLTSYFAKVADLFPNFVNEKCNGKRVTFIPTASILETEPFYVDANIKALEKIGLIVDELEVSKASNEEIQTKLRNNDYIFISGGNTFYLLQELRKSGADEIILEQIHSGKPYIGSSAGSIVLSSNLEYIKGIDDCSKAKDLKDFAALSVLSFYPMVHCTDPPSEKELEIISKYDSNLKLIPISDSQVILVEGENFEIESK